MNSILKYPFIMLGFYKDVWTQRGLLAQLIRNNLKSRYVNSVLGVLWAFIQPLATILVLWFVFEFGLRLSHVDDVPFFFWLVVALIPWFFLADAIQTSTSSILESSFLVKKIVFKISLLPIVKVLSAALIHAVALSFLVIVLWISGFNPNLYWLQVIYYFFASILLLIGIGWLTSSLVVFFRDLEQVVIMLVQLLFWLTPILWAFDKVPESYQWFFHLNPIQYIVEGYRDSFLFETWFWEKPYETAIFWGIVASFLFVGGVLFKKLKPHFADIL